MSFAVASPLSNVHTQSPTSHQILLNNVIAGEASLGQDPTPSPMDILEAVDFPPQMKSPQDATKLRLNSSTPVSSRTSQSPLATKDDMKSSSSRGSPLTETNASHAVAASLNTSQQNNMETLLSGVSNTDSMYPISLFQTRNSCKTLKCPKCNWHYKYRQTLEAHMKEKHFEETSDCVYCNASQPHPRLSRGESYSCGYKPFKCNVCNYSTTTKGNLSIHMQSDKHLYNARTLQQQDRIRQGVSTSSTFHVPRLPSSEGTTSQNENMQQTSIKGSSSPGTSSKIAHYSEASMEKQFQSKRRRSSSKTSSSIDSGIFSVPSKTGSPTFGRRETSSSNGGKWRCDVCSYETGISRNLRIHLTSEKHAQNLALRERGLLSTSRNENEVKDIKESSSETSQLPETGGNLQGLMEYYAAALKSRQQNGEGGDSSSRSFSLSDDVEKARKAQAQYLQHKLFLAQQQQLLLAQQYQQMMVAAAAFQQRISSQSKEELSQLSQINNPQLMLQNSQNQLWKQLFPQVNTDLLFAQSSQPPPKKKTETNTNLFSCGLCGVYGSDDINCLEAHVRKPRHTDVTDLTNNEWVTRTRNREREGYFCKLCAYNTPLKTNFNLHCKTEKHTSKLSLISHVREGGTATEWMIPHIIRGNMTQNVSCNACQFATHSFEKLKLHCATDQHQGVQTVCQYLQSMLNARVGQADGTGTYRFNCLACTDFATMHVVEMVRHMQTAQHQIELQKQENPGMAKLQDVVAIERQDPPESLETSKNHKDKKVEEKVSSRCDYCNYSTHDKDRMNLHVMTQHSGQPLATCPLCQEVVKSPLQLRIHLVEAHRLQVPPVESNMQEELSTADKSDIKKNNEDVDKMMIEHPKSEDLENEDTLNSHGLVIDEEVDNKTQGGEDNSLKNEPSTYNTDAEKSTTKRQIMGKNRSLDPNSLIMQVLKGNNGSLSKNFDSSEQKPLNFNKGETAVHGEAANSKIVNDTNAVFLDSEPMETVSRSCPNLVTSVNEQLEYSNNRPANFLGSRSRTKERTTNRIRVRSCPLDEPSRSRTYRRLLSDYGLEQARHYVENRSPHNRNKAKSYKIVKKEQRWSSLTDDLDNDSQVNRKQDLNESDSFSESNVVSAKNSLGENHMDVEEEGEGLVKTCRHCGKEFTGLWVLKAHEEVAHGVCVSAGNIQSVTQAYSEQFQEKLKNVATTEAFAQSATQDDFNNNPLQNVAQSNSVHSFLTPEADTKMLNTTSDTTLSLAEQQIQQQAILQSIIKAQAMKQVGASESTAPSTNGLDGIFPAGFIGEQNPLSANLASQMSMYSAFLQAQAIGTNPYQILSNAAALQQLQHLAGTGMLGLPDTQINRVAKSSFSNSLTTPNIPSTSSENQKSPTEKLEQQSHADGNASMIPSHMHARSSSLDIPLKRPRTRITDDQLKILRANFDINNSPSEQQIDDMAQSTSLPPKVIKHWFRNTLFKERQRSKDSPYNFNIPPITSLDDTVKAQLNNHEDTTKGETPNLHLSTFNDSYNSNNIKSELKADEGGKSQHGECIDEKENKALYHSNYDSRFSPSLSASEDKNKHNLNNQSSNLKNRQLPDFTTALTAVPNISSQDHLSSKQDTKDTKDKEDRNVSSLNSLAHISIPNQHFNPLANWQALTSYENSSNNDALFYENASSTDSMGIQSMQGSACRRTPRTRFTDFQLQVLQEFFEKNAYPKDDDLDRLSQTLSLSTRVIVVWFQNARQKARKSYEQQQQQQHGIHARYSPSGEHERGSLKFDERLSTATAGVEDLARKTLNEVSKSILNENKINVKSELTKEIIEATQKEIHLLPIKQDLENPLSQVKNANAKITLPCQLCEKTFLSVEQWQKHQQDHLRANVASMFGQYGLMYIQGLVGNQEDQNSKHSEEKSSVESSKVDVGKTEKDVNFAPGSIEALQESMKKSERKQDDSNKMTAFQNDKGFSLETSMVSSLGVTPSAGGSGKRKLSNSPTLSQTSPSSIPATSQSSSIRAKCSFMEDKDHMGMHKDPKRLRTTITPEQLEYLYQQYLVDSSPSRKIIEQISEVVGLKKRVVQVWFQNTRARERKGQFRSSISRCVTAQMNQYKLCPLCRMVFRTKEQYDVHVMTMHNQGGEPRTFDSEQPVEKKVKYSGYIGVENNNSNNSVNKESLSVKTNVHAKAPASEDAAVNLSAHVIKQPGMQRSSEPEKQEQAFVAVSTPATVDYSALFASNPNHPESIQLQQKLASIYANSSVSVTVTPTQNASTSPFGRDAPEAIETNRTSPAGSSNELMPINHKTSIAQSLETNLPLNFSTHPFSSPPKTLDNNKLAENTPCSSETSRSSATESQSSNIMQLNDAHDEMMNRDPMQISNADNDDLSTPTKRHRTQMSSSQVMALKHCFKVYKTPSLPECEELGRGIGLQKRVVQVWFQNARAKDKKRKLRSKVGVEGGENPTYDQDDRSDKLTECNICYPVVYYSSPQDARAHVFSLFHLQRLMRTVESERRKEFLSFSTSQSSPCSSSDNSTENQIQDHFGGDSLSSRHSPDTCDQSVNDAIECNTTLSGHMSISLHDRHQTDFGGNSLSGSESPNNSSMRSRSKIHVEPKIQSAGDTSDANQMDHSQLLQANPALLQHYHQAVQQLMMASQQGSDVEGSLEQQALLQQAVQKSLYQMLKRPQTSPTGSQ